MQIKVYINGEFADKQNAKVSVFDNGFLCGDGVFETMRAYNGAIFALDRHLDRLLSAARTLDINNTPDHSMLADACRGTLKANNLGDARIRLTMTSGDANSEEPTIVITAMPYSGYDNKLYKSGMSAKTLLGYRFSNSLTSEIKSTSYVSSVLARRKAVASGYDEAILLNEHQNITEGSYTNIFGVKDRDVYTPLVSDGLLPGVTREHVIDLSRKAGYKMLEKSIHIDELYSMDELFLTNSLMEIMPLTMVDGKAIGNRKPGPITLNIMVLYKERVLDSLD